MSNFRPAILAAVIALTACAKPPELPVSVKQCDVISGVGATVKVHNGSAKSVDNVRIVLDFYTDFKFEREDGAATFRPLLAPNADGVATVGLRNVKVTTGHLQRCAILSIVYGDGSTEKTELPTVSGT